MFDKDILDNLKGQEIKELIIDRKITLEELDTSALEKLLDYETDMLCLDMGDMELIHACAARLDELNGPAMTDEEFWSVIKKAEERMISGEKENTPVDAPVNVSARVVKKRIIWKKVWLVAAIVALLISAATMTASAFGFNVFDYFREVMGLPAGEAVDKGSITLINRSEATVYSSMDELLAEEDLDILYPTVLPDDNEFESVRIVESVGEHQIIILTNNPQINMIVYTNRTDKGNSFADCEVYLYNDVTFYINREIHTVCFYFDNNFYSIQADNYDNIILLIKNLKEY